jgi:hypothetical protein
VLVTIFYPPNAPQSDMHLKVVYLKSQYLICLRYVSSSFVISRYKSELGSDGFVLVFISNASFKFNTPLHTDGFVLVFISNAPLKFNISLHTELIDQSHPGYRMHLASLNAIKKRCVCTSVHIQCTIKYMVTHAHGSGET